MYIQADDGWSVEAGWGTEAALPLVEDETPPEAGSEGVQLSGDMAAEREADIGTSTTKNFFACVQCPEIQNLLVQLGMGVILSYGPCANE